MRTNYGNGDEITLQHNGCDGCSPASINGIICHESGCPYAWRDMLAECAECGDAFFRHDGPRQRLCDSCQNPTEDEEC